MIRHVVRPGEGLSSIADQHGFFPGTIWDDPANADLRAAREDPNILAPGDEVVIRDKRLRTEDCATTRRHTFKKRGVPALLRLQVFVADELQVNQAYELTIDGAAPRKGTTDGEGVLREDVMPSARSATLVIGPERHAFEIRLGFVDPVSTLAGVQSRLDNLGYPTKDLGAAVEAFQRASGIAVNGDWADPATKDALLRYHDTTARLPGEASGEATSALEEIPLEDEDD